MRIRFTYNIFLRVSKFAGESSYGRLVGKSLRCPLRKISINHNIECICIMTDQTYSFCLARKKKQLYNVPLGRFNLSSPYFNTITGEQLVDDANQPITRERLDMRRKAEILKYSSNRMSAQTNSLTKREKWSQLVNASGKSARLLDPETVVCPGETSVRIPAPIASSASDVPGPVVYLYEDPKVPLYNYIITRSYAFNVPNLDSYWKTTINTNVGLINGIRNQLFAININENVNQTRTTYSLDIPVGIYVEGTYSNGTVPINNEITITISSSKLDVFCNGTLVYSPPATAIHKEMKLTLSNIGKFQATRYVGTISFSNIVLKTSYAYVFEFGVALTFSVNTTNIDTHKFNNSIGESTLKCYAYGNMMDIIPQTTTNCVVSLPSAITATLPNPSIVGV